ncbi:MAG TPA: MBL fold metallo-hydrolase [Longimicrobiales bacterium]|nr:MBL fold metallo-hydrolase [Longimicrobiales bacterium]
MEAEEDTRPPHHGPDGRYRNPWPRLPPEPDAGDMLKWVWQRVRTGLPPDPGPASLPAGEPDLAQPRLPPAGDGMRATWVGQATFLVQLPGLNVLTDPMFADRASPLPWAGPRRLVPPGIALDALPPVDVVLLSHDHYDHLDRPSVRALAERFPAAAWFTPLGYRPWLESRGVARVVELDWWDEATHRGDTGVVAGIRGLPARHWTKRGVLDARRRLWSAWRLECAGRRVFFAGDSGYCPAFSEVAAREAPFDLVLLPIGAYEPRWFMAAAHMTPEEAAQAYADLGGRGAFVGMHWGTFRLTDEAPLEPPARLRRAWAALGHADADLYVPRHGETLRL